MKQCEYGRKCWFVMRDLKRSNAKLPAYKQLELLGMEVFTPLKWRLTTKNGKRVRELVPCIQDLLFVYDTRIHLDDIVSKIGTLQYRFQKGGKYCDPMIVPDADMERFVKAVRDDDKTRYYLPEELTPSMYGRKIRIIGGPLEGYEGCLLKVKGARIKRLLVELPMWLTAAVEVEPEYIQLI